MKMLPIKRLIKHAISIDGFRVGEFYVDHIMNPSEASDLEAEYANSQFISSRGVCVYRVMNDNKIHGMEVIPHYGKIS